MKFEVKSEVREMKLRSGKSLRVGQNNDQTNEDQKDRNIEVETKTKRGTFEMRELVLSTKETLGVYWNPWKLSVENTNWILPRGREPWYIVPDVSGGN